MCHLFGEEIEKGESQNDMEWTRKSLRTFVVTMQRPILAGEFIFNYITLKRDIVKYHLNM